MLPGYLVDSPVERQITPAEFALFRDLIQVETGIALKDTKRTLLVGRLGRRLAELGLDSFSAYYRVLRGADPGGTELARMINCITTNKTAFFREEEHFAVLADHLRAAAAASPPPYRIWSSACSTGEEPYSIAITAIRAAHGHEVRILASDIDTEVLARAEEGVYPLGSLDAIDESTRHRFFLRGSGEYEGLTQVKPAPRALVRFRRINLMADPWPIRTVFDAIFCRNVIIYFNRETQRRLFARMADYLAPNGLLFVGHSETLHQLSDVLIPVQHSVYRLRT